MSDEETYRKRTRSSAELYDRACKVMPGGISHTIRFSPPYPFYLKKAKGARIWDVDGNEYVDYWMGHTALILGHTPRPVIEAIREQVSTGCQWGIVNPLQVELAEMLAETVPCAEMVRFCNTGAEATMYACRLARGYTGRSKIAKMEGGWHGFNPVLLAYIHEPFDEPESLGLGKGTEDTIPLPYNDIEGSLEVIRSNRRDLAGIILEPVLGSGGFLPAEPEYLQALREAASETGAVLIFDEIITGFRLSLGGGQEFFNVIPDLTTLGKILGGGMPVGAVVGSSEIIGRSDATNSPPGRSVAIGGGTFSSNPITMRAGLETLRYLRSNPSLYDRIGDLGRRARREIEQNLIVDDRYVCCTGIGSLFRTHFAFEEGQEIRSARDAAKADKSPHEWFRIAMANRGILLVEGGGTISEAHEKSDVRDLGQACQEISN